MYYLSAQSNQHHKYTKLTSWVNSSCKELGNLLHEFTDVLRQHIWASDYTERKGGKKGGKVYILVERNEEKNSNLPRVGNRSVTPGDVGGLLVPGG